MAALQHGRRGVLCPGHAVRHAGLEPRHAMWHSCSQVSGLVQEARFSGKPWMCAKQTLTIFRRFWLDVGLIYDTMMITYIIYNFEG